MIYALGNLVPCVAATAFIAPDATLIGDVTVGEHSSVWFRCVLRGDTNRIRIGARSNVQDGAILHVNPGDAFACLIGDDVTIGHGAIVHGCRLEDGAFVGMGAIVLDAAVIQTGGVLAAGALLAPGKRIGRGELWIGRPARLARVLDRAEQETFAATAARYVENGRHFAAMLGQRGAAAKESKDVLF